MEARQDLEPQVFCTKLVAMIMVASRLIIMMTAVTVKAIHCRWWCRRKSLALARKENQSEKLL